MPGMEGTQPVDGESTNAGGTQPAGKPANAGAGKTYTQAELDQIVTERLGREQRKASKGLEDVRAAAIAEWRESQGLDDEALEALAKRDEAAAAQRKRDNEYKALQKSQKDTQSKLDAANARLDVLRRDAVFKAAAGRTHDPEAVMALLNHRIRLREDYSIEVLDEKGQPSDMSVEDAVNQLLQQKRYLVPASGSFAGSGARASVESSSRSNGNDGKALLTREGRIGKLKSELGSEG